MARGLTWWTVLCAAALLILASSPASAQCTDNDGDGFFAEEECGALVDCNDDDSETYPGAFESCNGFDDDCDGLRDNGVSCDTTCDDPEEIGSDRVAVERLQFATSPDLVWNGQGYAAVWIDYPEGGRGAVYFGLFDSSGEPTIDPVQVSDVTTDLYTGGAPPQLVWTGQQYGIAWRMNDHQVYFARVDSTGVRQGPQVQITHVPIAGHVTDDTPSLVWTGSEFGLAWSDMRLNPGFALAQVFFVRLDRLGNEIGDETQWTFSSDSSSAIPVLAWSGTNYACVWRHDGFEFQRFSRIGEPIDAPIQLFDSSTPRYSHLLEWNGNGFGFAYREVDSGGVITRLRFVLLDDLGNLRSEPIIVPDGSGDSGEVDMVWTGGDYGLAWNVTPDWSIHFSRVDEHGGKVGDDLLIVSAPEEARLPSIAWNGTDFGVAWADGRDSPSSHEPEIYFTQVGCNCVDLDGDGVSSCNDCNDDDPTVRPSALELCNEVDDDCDGMVDDRDDLEDADSDGVRGACDNCPATPNATQTDSDLDRVGDACDNCVATFNGTQPDGDTDGQGDHCDLDDGLIYLLFNDPTLVEWQEETGFTKWNSYRGDLAVLRATGVYTQVPGSNDLARRDCRLRDPWIEDLDLPSSGRAAYYLTTGIFGNDESGLGNDSAGTPRPNDNPCP